MKLYARRCALKNSMLEWARMTEGGKPSVLEKLGKIPGIGSVATSLLHLSAVFLKKDQIASDFSQLFELNLHPAQIPAGEKQNDIIVRLNNMLGEGIIFRLARLRHYKTRTKSK